jgi:hypothetical protein
MACQAAYKRQRWIVIVDGDIAAASFFCLEEFVCWLDEVYFSGEIKNTRWLCRHP